VNTSPILIGQRFGLLTALERLPPWKDRTMWRCRCECGNERNVSTYELQSGRAKRCRKTCKIDWDNKTLVSAMQQGRNSWFVDSEFDE
jgi:hypothetical protein